MNVTVVINTYNRAGSLRRTLQALRHQTHANFEVVVVSGPSTDDTEGLLSERSNELRAVSCPEAHLGKSRNLGIDAAAGDIVAFVDDDGIPEPDWLEGLIAAYDDAEVGGAGGVVMDYSGVNVQYRFSLCDRRGNTYFDCAPPFDQHNFPGADPFVYLQGTNMSFRRAALKQIGGFDEEIEYNYDESDVCLQVIDAGWKLRPIDGAVVHHKFLPSHLRRDRGVFTDPFHSIKNRAYFALRNGKGRYGEEETLRSLDTYVSQLEEWARENRSVGRFSAKEHEMFVGRLHSGYLLGVERGLEGKRKSRQIAPRPAAEFRRYPTFRPRGRRLSVCFVSLDYPPRPVAGIARFTGDLARGFAEAGHEVHVVTRDPDGPYRMDFEEGFWVHRYPGGGRWIPAYDGRHPLQPNFEHLAAVYGAVRRIVERRRLDVVSGPLWNAEILFCAFDPRFVTTMTCMTPMRVVAEHHPAVAAQGHTAWKIKLEDAALRIVPHLQPVSHAHAEELARLPGVDPDKMQTIWHGVFDRAREFPRRRRDADAVEVLFIGRLEPRKGVDVLFNAAMDILRQRPNFHLRLVGTDTGASSGGVSYRKWLGERCREPEVLNRVIFEGEVTDERLYRAYAEADIFCAPSRYESFGLVAAEAMMMSLPVVATEVGGLTEIVEHGATGLLVPPDDVEALRAALFTLIDDGELRAQFGKAGRDRYEKEFRNEIAVERTAAWFERLSDGVASQPLLSNEVVQDRVVRAAAGVLERVAELEPESSVGVAARLLDPVAFPIDYVGAVRRLLSGSDLGFVAGLYRLFFDREPDPEGVRSYLEGLTGRLSRPELVREMAFSEEARGRSVDPRFVDDPELLQLFFDADSTQTWLSQIAQSSHILFVQAIYRLVLGRPPDPNGASHYLDLLNRGTPRSEVVRALLHSEEARRRGLGVEIVDRLSRAAADLDGGLTIRVVRRVPIVRRLARLITKQRAGSKVSSNVAALQLILEEQNRSILEGNRRGAEIVGELKKLSSSIGSLGVAEVARSIDEIRARVIELNDRVVVMQTKQEAVAIDVRERIAASPQPEELPEPVVLNPNVLEEKIKRQGALKLNLGCGEKPLAGYVNVDFRNLPGVDVVADVRKLPFDRGSVDEIMSAHLIEHFRERQFEAVVLPYWRSLLKIGGTLRIICPNWQALIEEYAGGRLSLEDFKLATFGLQDYSGDDHHAMYSPESLRKLLEQAGFEEINMIEERRRNGLTLEMELVAKLKSASRAS